jgi:hypothetical protein
MHNFQAAQKKADIEVPVDTAARETERQTAMVEQALAEARKKRLLEEASASAPPQQGSASPAAEAAQGAATDEEAKMKRLSAFVGSMSEGQEAVRTATRPPPPSTS